MPIDCRYASIWATYMSLIPKFSKTMSVFSVCRCEGRSGTRQPDEAGGRGCGLELGVLLVDALQPAEHVPPDVTERSIDGRAVGHRLVVLVEVDLRLAGADASSLFVSSSIVATPASGSHTRGEVGLVLVK